ncbi:MAG TPA: hypothetical protein P5346_01105 [Spirochaetota bacterium]|nr:hypothetical protein [Spirochaetota bacterium]HSA13310.1 hypothetical protein [Spirochaetota bacterium]
MEKKYYELVLEGDYNAINGLLNGFLLGKNHDWTFYFSKKAGVKTETLIEVIADWISMKNKIHHIIMEDVFYKELRKAVEKYNKPLKIKSKFVNLNYIKSAKLIKKAHLNFKAITYGRQHAAEMKFLLKNIPAGIVLQNYKPVEKVVKDVKGVELYAPEHEYTFEASGTLVGNIGTMIDLKQKLDDYPLIEADKIHLKF